MHYQAINRLQPQTHGPLPIQALPRPVRRIYPRDALRAAPEIAATTGPLDILRGKRVLLLADVENLTYSGRNDLRVKISYRGLLTRINALAASCAPHAFFSRDPSSGERWGQYFAERGWIPHARDIETIRTCRGVKRHANSDNFILFNAGLLVSRSNAEIVAIASGDGELGCDLATAIAGLPKPRIVITLSLAGSTSSRLDAARNGQIAANIELGRDCMRPVNGH
jgi:hypothetical protein